MLVSVLSALGIHRCVICSSWGRTRVCDRCEKHCMDCGTRLMVCKCHACTSFSGVPGSACPCCATESVIEKPRGYKPPQLVDDPFEVFFSDQGHTPV